MADKYIMVDMNDERTEKIAEIMSSKTAKKILSLISESEKELSENDISLRLKIPLNTVDYNIKKILSAGLIEESRSFFWSVKGKKIKTYKPANKKIIISTKTSFKGLISSVLIFGAIGFAANVFRNIFSSSRSLYGNNFVNIVTENTDKLAAGSASMGLASPQASNSAANLISANTPFAFSSLFHSAWLWVMTGVLIGVAGFFAYKFLMKGGFK